MKFGFEYNVQDLIVTALISVIVMLILKMREEEDDHE